MKFEIFIAVKIHTVAYWVMRLCCSLTGSYQCFEGKDNPHLQAIPTVKMEAIYSSETLVTNYQTVAQSHNPEDYIYTDSYENAKSHTNTKTGLSIY
jgi:hypothetical protein